MMLTNEMMDAWRAGADKAGALAVALVKARLPKRTGAMAAKTTYEILSDGTIRITVPKFYASWIEEGWTWKPHKKVGGKRVTKAKREAMSKHIAGTHAISTAINEALPQMLQILRG